VHLLLTYFRGGHPFSLQDGGGRSYLALLSRTCATPVYARLPGIGTPCLLRFAAPFACDTAERTRILFCHFLSLAALRAPCMAAAKNYRWRLAPSYRRGWAHLLGTMRRHGVFLLLRTGACALCPSRHARGIHCGRAGQACLLACSSSIFLAVLSALSFSWERCPAVYRYGG